MEVGWDAITNTVKASLDGWDKFIKECIDLFKSSLNMKKKESTPPKSKRSKFVTSSEKPAKNSIKEAMTLLKDMKDTIFVDKYLAAASVLPMGQRDVSSCAITIRLSGNGCVALLALERTRCIYSFSKNRFDRTFHVETHAYKADSIRSKSLGITSSVSRISGWIRTYFIICAIR
ncbi:hypothetical protein CDL15_Pgr005139 [Punica granatum]|uniref:Uncharacterized protein n=1 Tax=Punica granatum TaxID=22663 RepID=A0A218WQC8_PUNGR|nr:hypothetical protein CDL15_Pgr005139 [Punica granatum]